MSRTRAGQIEATSQLSLDVRQRPSLEDPLLTGSLKLKGDLPVKRDLQVGEQITVTVADADGIIFATGLFEVGAPGFKELKMRDVGPIGLERVHTAQYDPEG